MLKFVTCRFNFFGRIDALIDNVCFSSVKCKNNCNYLCFLRESTQNDKTKSSVEGNIGDKYRNY